MYPYSPAAIRIGAGILSRSSRSPWRFWLETGSSNQ
jgi:hypothetical protein